MVEGVSDVLVIGGGPAGATAAARLAGLGFSVLLLEKHASPRPKVCGEFLSPEGVRSLRCLGWEPEAAAPIRTVTLYRDDRAATALLDPPAWGLSRLVLDEGLLGLAVRNGARVWRGYEATAVHRAADVFRVRARRMRDGAEAEFYARHVVGAFGIKSGAAVPLPDGSDRSRAGAIAFNVHFRCPAVDGRVELYFFDHGYVGLGNVEGGRVNLCGLVEADFFRRLGRRFDALIGYLVERSRAFRERMDVASDWEPYAGTTPLRFGVGRRVWDGVALVGDRAGAVHPFCGDGIAMAVQGALLWADSMAEGRAGGWSSEAVLREYDRRWRRAFGACLRTSRWLDRVRRWPLGLSVTLGFMRRYPSILTWLIERTRGGYA